MRPTMQITLPTVRVQLLGTHDDLQSCGRELLSITIVHGISLMWWWQVGSLRL